MPGVRLDYSSNSRRVGSSAALRRPAGPDDRLPAHDAEGGRRRLLRAAAAAADRPRLRSAGRQVEPRHAVRRRARSRRSRAHVEVSLEGFYKLLDNLVTAGYYNEGHGRAYGIETLIRWKPDGRFFGWLAYTLSRSQRTQPPSDVETLYQYDQTHILTVLGSYKLGHGWEFGARFRLVSGNMYTPSPTASTTRTPARSSRLPSYPRFNSRLPIFEQLDLRVDKTWQFTHWKLGAYLDVMNVYNRGNVEGVTYNYNFTQQSTVTGIPFLPNLGLRADF